MFEYDIVMQANLYAETREGHLRGWTDPTVLKFKAFWGTILLMIAILLLHLHCYWSTNYSLGAPHIVQVLPRDCYLRELHFNNSTAEGNLEMIEPIK